MMSYCMRSLLIKNVFCKIFQAKTFIVLCSVLVKHIDLDPFPPSVLSVLKGFKTLNIIG